MACVLALTCALGTSPAFATDYSGYSVADLQAVVERTAAEYNDAVAARQEAEQQAAEGRERIAEIESQIPAAQDAAAEAICAQYKYQQNAPGIIDVILGADDFESLITMIEYFDAIETHHSNQISELVALQDQLHAEQEALDATVAQQTAYEQQAAAALEEAQAARAEAQRRAEEEARRQAEAAAAAARAAAASAAAAGQTITDNGDGTVTVYDDQGNVEYTAPAEDVPTTPVPDSGAGTSTPVVSDRDAFISEWGARIDSYLGSRYCWTPLQGYGSVMAAAAWDYGVDPRCCAAIAGIESSWGNCCFRSYNAWGWGSKSWGSWEDAIYSWTAGFASGYGYTVTVGGAQMYCPPTWEAWYSKVTYQMSLI